MSSASPYLFSYNKAVPIIFREQKLLPEPAAPTAGLLPTAVSAIGQQLDLQRAKSSTLIDEIEETLGYSGTYYPDFVVPLPPPTMMLVGTVTFVQYDLEMPESADDYPYLT